MLQPVRQKALPDRPDFREDALHFRSGTVAVTVEVTPQRRRTPMGDLVFRAFLGDKEIEVVFTGRRQAAAVPLMQRLQAKLRLRQIDKPGGGAIVTDAVWQEVRIDGSWRVRLMNEQDATPERRFQLVAARWRYRGPNGVEQVFGYMPNY